MLFMLCVCYVYEVLLIACCFVGLFREGFLLNLLLFWLSSLRFSHVGFHGCVGKGHSWTSLVRVSSHGERREKRVECMGLYLPFHACIVE